MISSREETPKQNTVRLVIPSPGWPCCPFSPALSSSGFHGNMLFLVFSSLSVSMWRTDLYSFVQPLVTASVSSLLTLASISYFTAASLLLLPKPVSQSGLLDPFVTILLGRRQDARSHVFRVNFSVLQSCCSSAIHTTVHQTAQDRIFAVILSSPLLLPSQCQRHWGLSLLSLSWLSVFFSPFPLSPPQAGPLPSVSWITALIFSLGFLLLILHLFNPVSMVNHRLNMTKPLQGSPSFFTF